MMVLQSGVLLWVFPTLDFLLATVTPSCVGGLAGFLLCLDKRVLKCLCKWSSAVQIIDWLIYWRFSNMMYNNSIGLYSILLQSSTTTKKSMHSFFVSCFILYFTFVCVFKGFREIYKEMLGWIRFEMSLTFLCFLGWTKSTLSAKVVFPQMLSLDCWLWVLYVF